MRHLILRLQSPMMSFGSEAVDAHGTTYPYPPTSMLTGLIANALGWRRTDTDQLARLQDRIIYAARIEREPSGGTPWQDYQTAQLGHRDAGWTTSGVPEHRTGEKATYKSPHIRFRDYLPDMAITIAIRLRESDEFPTLDHVRQAFNKPARPLFIGRKPFIPSTRIFDGETDAQTALQAILNTPPLEQDVPHEPLRLLWFVNDDDASVEAHRTYQMSDRRDHRTGFHGGGNWVKEGLQQT